MQRRSSDFVGMRVGKEIDRSRFAGSGGTPLEQTHHDDLVESPFPQGQTLTTAFSGTLIKEPLLTVGNGSGWVYCYYLPYVRAAKQHGGQRTWPCKIGYTNGDDVRDRVAQQFITTGSFEAPEIGFCARSDNPQVLEDDMHSYLKAFLERKRRQRIGGGGFGTEWFETNLKEVRRAYREAMWPNNRLRRIWMWWKIELAAWRTGIDRKRRLKGP